MNEMAAQLKETYGAKDTYELIELRARNELTDIARTVLDEELKKREVSPAEIEREQFRRAEEAQALEHDIANLASLGSRLVATAIDIAGILAVMFAVYYLLFLYTPRPFFSAIDGTSILMVLGYLLFKDGFNGQSVGKRLMGIKVIEVGNGLTCSLPKSLVRNLLSAFGLFDWIFIFGRKRQRLGDIAAGTYVVRA